MKPETEQLLHQCRSALLQQSNQQLHTLFVSWFERVVGEESIEETLDDLCLLLGYGIRSAQSQILYATYTAWWEVEGCADLDGEFECVEVAALQHRLITMPIKQFALLADLAYHVCVLDAEVEGQPHPPTGQEWLRALADWLSTGAREPFHNQNWRIESHTPSPIAQSQLTRKQRRTQQRKLEQKLVEQAWQRGYLLLDPEVGMQVPILVQSRCRKNRRPYISVQQLLMRLEADNVAKAQFFEVFAFELAVPPWELETLLGCTTTERKRWTGEERLPVLGYGSFRKAGNDHAYPLYDRRVILALTSGEIEAWRSEHQARVRVRRQAAAQAAAASRKARRREEQMVRGG